MKLHLPKTLLVAVLAACVAPSSWATNTGWGEPAPNSGIEGKILYIDGTGTAGVDTSGITITGYNDSTTSIATADITQCTKAGYSTTTTLTIAADCADNKSCAGIIGELTINKDSRLNVDASGWGTGRVFDALTIDKLTVKDSGATVLNIAANQKVIIAEIDGSLSGVTNSGTLTIGTDATSTTALGGSISNSGTLNLKGAFTAASFEGFSTTAYGTLSNTTHGFTVGKEATVIAKGGTISTSDFSFTLNGNNITESLTTSNGYVLYIAEDAAASTGTIYEITSAHTTAVEYNGISGDTATATGFVLANGTTVKLTGDYSKLTEGIKIAAGSSGTATVSIANAKSQSYESLGLASLITKESGNYVLNIDGIGTEVTTGHSGSTGFHTVGEVSITNGGKLTLNNKDCLGWDSGATSKISILNGTLALRGRQTCSTDINMLGGAVIEAADNPLGVVNNSDDSPMIHVYNGMAWTVSGADNVVKSDVKIRMDKNVDISVSTDSDLSIQGTFTGNGIVTKSGAGKLILNGVAKTINGQLQMTGGTLQLGGTTTSDGLVTLAGGIKHTAGKVQVTGNAAITGNSELGGILQVDATGNLTLGKTYTLTGALSIAEGGKLTGGTGMTVGESTAPAAGTNGWDSAIVTVLQTADANVNNISGLSKIWWTDGNAYDITSSSSGGVTSYIAGVGGVNYYVQDAANKVEYSTESGLTRAGMIYMSDNTTLVVKDNLSSSKVTVAEGASVNYEVDGAVLDLYPNSGTKSLIITNGGKVEVKQAAAVLGSADKHVQVALSEGGNLSFINGQNGGAAHLDVTVTGTGLLTGSWQGNALNVQGLISGEQGSTLELAQRTNSTNTWKISSVISGDLAVKSNALVTLSGNNTYTGGTTITGGTLIMGHANALGSKGGVTMQGGNLQLNVDAGIKSLNVTGESTLATNSKTLTVSDGITTSSKFTVNGGGTVEVKGNLNATGTFTLGTTEGTTVELYGSNNSVTIFDLSNTNNAKGQIKLMANTKTTITSTNKGQTNAGALWMSANASVVLEDKASLSWLGATVTALNGGAEISTSINRNVYLVENTEESAKALEAATVANAKVEVSVANEGYISSKLENVALYNNGTGALNISGTDNTLTELHALKGSINVTGQDSLVLNVVTVAQGQTLTAGTVAVGSAVATLGTESPTYKAAFEGGAKVDGNLDLSYATTLQLDKMTGTDLVTVTGDLTLPGGTLTLNGDILAKMGELVGGATLDIFSVGGAFNYAGQAVNDGFTIETGPRLDKVFDNGSSDYYLGYTMADGAVGGTVYIGKVIPEPTTATLSLLALAALAARRRRK